MHAKRLHVGQPIIVQHFGEAALMAVHPSKSLYPESFTTMRFSSGTTSTLLRHLEHLLPNLADCSADTLHIIRHNKAVLAYQPVVEASASRNQLYTSPILLADERIVIRRQRCRRELSNRYDSGRFAVAEEQMSVTLQTEVGTKAGQGRSPGQRLRPSNPGGTGLALVQGQDKDAANEAADTDEDEGCARHIPPPRKRGHEKKERGCAYQHCPADRPSAEITLHVVTPR